MARKQDANARRAAEARKWWESRQEDIFCWYYHNGFSQRQIGRYLGVSQSLMAKWLPRLGIPSRSKGRAGKQSGQYKTGRWSVIYRTLVEKEECARCGTTERLCIHHLNNDRYDNRLTNLQVLCESCHMSVTKKAWWDAKKCGAKLPKSNAPQGWKGKERYP